MTNLSIRATEAAGYALLVPWFAAQAIDGLAVWQATAALFMLPVFAMMLGLAGVHALLWQRRSVALFGALVVLASLCLVGSVVGSAVGGTESARVVVRER